VSDVIHPPGDELVIGRDEIREVLGWSSYFWQQRKEALIQGGMVFGASKENGGPGKPAMAAWKSHLETLRRVLDRAKREGKENKIIWPKKKILPDGRYGYPGGDKCQTTG